MTTLNHNCHLSLLAKMAARFAGMRVLKADFRMEQYETELQPIYLPPSPMTRQCLLSPRVLQKNAISSTSAPFAGMVDASIFNDIALECVRATLLNFMAHPNDCKKEYENENMTWYAYLLDSSHAEL